MRAGLVHVSGVRSRSAPARCDLSVVPARRVCLCARARTNQSGVCVGNQNVCRPYHFWSRPYHSKINQKVVIYHFRPGNLQHCCPVLAEKLERDAEAHAAKLERAAQEDAEARMAKALDRAAARKLAAYEAVDDDGWTTVGTAVAPQKSRAKRAEAAAAWSEC